MFEAKLLEGNILKKIVEAIKDVVSDVNIDVSPSGKFAFSLACNWVGVLDHDFVNVFIKSCEDKIAAQIHAQN